MTNRYESKVKYTNGHAVYRSNGLMEVYTAPSGKYITLLDVLITILMILAVVTIVSVLWTNLDSAYQYYQAVMSFISG